MKKQVLSFGAAILALTLLTGIPAHSQGKSNRGGGNKDNPIPLTLRVYDTVIDEHDNFTLTNGAEGCQEFFSQPSRYTGDIPGVNQSVYTFGSPWVTDFALADDYQDNLLGLDNYGLRARFDQGKKVLSFDTNGTTRKVTVDLSSPCDNGNGDNGCPGEPGIPAEVMAAFGTETPTLEISGLLEVFLGSPYPDMEVCDTTGGSRACPQSSLAFAKFWFDDPSGRTWRLDWSFLRVLRMDANNWYFIADECGGSQVAGLSNLESSNRKRPKEIFDGYYKVPFFLVAVQP